MAVTDAYPNDKPVPVITGNPKEDLMLQVQAEALASLESAQEAVRDAKEAEKAQEVKRYQWPAREGPRGVWRELSHRVNPRRGSPVTVKQKQKGKSPQDKLELFRMESQRYGAKKKADRDKRKVQHGAA